jgi:hypothetical protein
MAAWSLLLSSSAKDGNDAHASKAYDDGSRHEGGQGEGGRAAPALGDGWLSSAVHALCAAGRGAYRE